MSNFDIKRSSPRKHQSLQTPVAEALRGQFFQESAVAGVAELANGEKPLAGCLTRDVKVGGPTLADHVYPGRLELPFTAGLQASFEKAEEFEAEGTDYLAASGGGGAITSGTTLETELSLINGKLCVRGGAQIGFYRLKEIMTPETSGALRIRAAQIDL